MTLLLKQQTTKIKYKSRSASTTLYTETTTYQPSTDILVKKT